MLETIWHCTKFARVLEAWLKQSLVLLWGPEALYNEVDWCCCSCSVGFLYCPKGQKLICHLIFWGLVPNVLQSSELPGDTTFSWFIYLFILSLGNVYIVVMKHGNACVLSNWSLTRMLFISGQMTQLCELINKSGELLAKNLSHLDTVLGALDVQEHSLGVLAVL